MAQLRRKATAVWRGDLKGGKGVVSAQSGVLRETQYSFSARFESGAGTNPEELIAAAHAGCFTMALSAQLGNAGLVPEKLETTATITFEKLEAGWDGDASSSGCERQSPESRCGSLEKSHRCGQDWLLHLAPAEHDDHDGRETGGMTTMSFCKDRMVGCGRETAFEVKDHAASV